MFQEIDAELRMMGILFILSVVMLWLAIRSDPNFKFDPETIDGWDF